MLTLSLKIPQSQLQSILPHSYSSQLQANTFTQLTTLRLDFWTLAYSFNGLKQLKIFVTGSAKLWKWLAWRLLATASGSTQGCLATEVRRELDIRPASVWQRFADQSMTDSGTLMESIYSWLTHEWARIVHFCHPWSYVGLICDSVNAL